MSNLFVRLVVGVIFLALGVLALVSIVLYSTGWHVTIVKVVALIGIGSLSAFVLLFRWEEFKSISADLQALFADYRRVNMDPEIGERYVNRDVKLDPPSKITRRQRART